MRDAADFASDVASSQFSVFDSRANLFHTSAKRRHDTLFAKPPNFSLAHGTTTTTKRNGKPPLAPPPGTRAHGS